MNNFDRFVFFIVFWTLFSGINKIESNQETIINNQTKTSKHIEGIVDLLKPTAVDWPAYRSISELESAKDSSITVIIEPIVDGYKRFSTTGATRLEYSYH